MSPAVRLAICGSGEIWGGVEQFIQTLSRWLTRQGIPVVVVVLYNGPLLERLKRDGADVELVAGHGRYDVSTIRRLRAVLRNRRINVLHTHGYKAAVIGAIAARLEGVSHVRTEHGRVEPWSGRARLKMAANAWLERAVSRWLTNAIVFVSHDIQRRSQLGPSGPAQRVIYNGIDPTEPGAEGPSAPIDALPGGPNAFHVGIVGRLAPIKGHSYLFQAVAALIDDRDIHVQVLGSGPLEEECRVQCRALGIADRVHFLGFRPNARAYMRQFQSLAMPSLYEGLPYTLLEAMFYGVPVIASNVGGLAEVIEDARTGLLVPPGDSGALARGLRQLKDDEELRRNLARNARQLVADRFLADHMARQYLDVYSSLCAGS